MQVRSTLCCTARSPTPVFHPQTRGIARRLALYRLETLERKIAAALAIIATSSSDAWRGAAAAPVPNCWGLRGRVKPGAARVRSWLTFVVEKDLERLFRSTWTMLLLSKAKFVAKCAEALAWPPSAVEEALARIETMPVPDGRSAH